MLSGAASTKLYDPPLSAAAQVSAWTENITVGALIPIKVAEAVPDVKKAIDTGPCPPLTVGAAKNRKQYLERSRWDRLDKRCPRSLKRKRHQWQCSNWRCRRCWSLV